MPRRSLTRHPALAEAGRAAYAPRRLTPVFLTLAAFAVLATLAVREGADLRGRELLERIVRGERQGLKTLYDALASRVLALALRLLRDRNDAEEIVQETFVEVWRRAAEYDPRRGDVTAWVMTIARTRALDRLRASGRAARVREEAAGEPVIIPAAPGLELAEHRQARERILRALEAIPAEQRRMIELAYYDGLTQTEIAALTGDPLGTVKTRMRLGMQKLAVLLGELREDAT